MDVRSGEGVFPTHTKAYMGAGGSKLMNIECTRFFEWPLTSLLLNLQCSNLYISVLCCVVLCCVVLCCVVLCCVV